MFFHEEHNDPNRNNDITFTLNQIINKELSKEAVLKEVLAAEEAVTSLNKSIRELTAQSENAVREKVRLEEKSDELRAQLEISRIQISALKDQLEHGKTVSEKLQLDIEKGISEVWKLRSELAQATQELSEQCDIWALMMKPIPSESTILTDVKEEDKPIIENYDERLKLAVERKQRALAERDRLRNYPETSEEYLKIKNAIRYISEISAQKAKEVRSLNDRSRVINTE